MSDPALDARVDALRRDGRHADAAALCAGAGEWVRAAALYADVWQWEDAVNAAERAGRLDEAYRYALEGGMNARLGSLVEALGGRPEQAARAAEHATRRGRLGDAARLRERIGEVDEAAVLFERAGEPFEAARCRERAGAYREAGVLYERHLSEHPTDGEAALRLGRILAQFGRFDHAVRALQKAARDPDRTGPALRLMVACFAALGMETAAASCLDRLRDNDPALPITVPEFLRESFGDERGLEATAEERAGARLLAGRYRVLRPLGAGATGRVVLAHDDFYDRLVAVKVLTVGAGTTGRDAYIRFAREARVAAGIDHPNIIRIHEYNPEGPFLVMEYMEGGTLEDRLGVCHGAGLPLELVRHVLVSLLEGLDAVHRRGVVHRDLKPANVFFAQGSDVKIGDFGVAHLADLGSTLTGAMIGSLAYMAPEQITGAGGPKASTDLYAVGVLTFRMLTGRLPFPGPDFVAQHLEQSPPAPGSVAPELDDTYDELVLALLEKDPGERPDSAADVRSWVESLVWKESTDTRVPAQATDEGRESRPSTMPPPPDERYALLEPLADGGWRARDAILDRIVRVIPCDGARAEALQAFARADGPYLQAVYDIDLERQRAIVESPSGTPLGEVDPSERHAIASELEQALAALHAVRLAHGHVDADHVLLAPGRPVLLLPDTPGTDPAADLAALRALLGID